MTQQEQALIKIITKKHPEPKLIQIMEPVEDKMLLIKPNGHMIATNASFKLMKLLIEEYKKDEAKLENKLVSKLKSTFTTALRTEAERLMDGAN